MTTIELKKLAKAQNVTVTTEEAKKWNKIIKIVDKHPRDIKTRYFELIKQGFYPVDNPMPTGFGVGKCIRRMKNGSLRIRVSANWSGGFCNYADCVTI